MYVHVSSVSYFSSVRIYFCQSGGYVIVQYRHICVHWGQVGSEFTRGVSGGERKRCNIGLELIISPTILYLDEPTTGLDSSTATSVVQLLKK